MNKLNENIFHQYNKWKTGYVRKENSILVRINQFLSVERIANDVRKGNFEKIISDYTINYEDGNYSIDINMDEKDGNYNDISVHIFESDLINGELPFKFGKINASFCIDCDVKSLKNSPDFIRGGLVLDDCTSLTSLVGITQQVDWSLNLIRCKSITSLEGLCKEKKSYHSINCDECSNLETLNGAPIEIDGYFSCSKCPALVSLDGLPEIIHGTLYVDKRFKGKIPEYVKALEVRYE